MRNFKKNYFGHKIYSPQEILNDTVAMSFIKVALYGILKQFGINKSEIEKIIWTFSNEESECNDPDIERKIKGLLNLDFVSRKLKGALEQRASKIAEQINEFIIGETFIDVGCGDALVELFLKGKFKDVLLVDIEKFLDSRINYRFVKCKEGDKFPAKGKFDTSLLLTVLHHSRDPLTLLKNTTKVTQKRLIVIESVVGVRINNFCNFFNFNLLDLKSQYRYASFVDWFYNRILHDDVQVTYNYNTPNGWEKIFRNYGWRLNKRIEFGMDQPLVPEYHVMFILDKN